MSTFHLNNQYADTLKTMFSIFFFTNIYASCREHFISNDLFFCLRQQVIRIAIGQGSYG